MKKIDIALPNGSNWRQLQQFLPEAGYPVEEPNREGICGETEYFRFYQVDRRSVSHFIDSGGFSAGITGYDLYLNSGVEDEQISLATLNFSRKTLQPTRWVLAKCTGHQPLNPDRRSIITELPRLADYLLQKAQVPFEYRLVSMEGNEELWLKRMRADYALVVTETGESLKRHGLEIVPGFDSLLVSQPRIFCQTGVSTEVRALLEDFAFALRSVVNARHYVMVTFNIQQLDLRRIEKNLPAEIAPTTMEIMQNGWCAVQICMPRVDYGEIGRMIREHGGRSIVMQDVAGFDDGFDRLRHEAMAADVRDNILAKDAEDDRDDEDPSSDGFDYFYRGGYRH